MGHTAGKRLGQGVQPTANAAHVQPQAHQCPVAFSRSKQHTFMPTHTHTNYHTYSQTHLLVHGVLQLVQVIHARPVALDDHLLSVHTQGRLQASTQSMIPACAAPLQPGCGTAPTTGHQQHKGGGGHECSEPVQGSNLSSKEDWALEQGRVDF